VKEGVQVLPVGIEAHTDEVARREREWRLKQSHQKLGKKLCPSVWRSVGLAAALITDADLEASLNPAARDDVLRDDVVQLRARNVIWMGILFFIYKMCYSHSHSH